MAPVTPMMRQYFEIKEKYKEYILFYRLGDFYEMFFDDAKRASKELELTLTGRDCGEEERAPMCGVPYHSAEGYIAKLIAKGYKVAICEQTEDPAQAKGIVARDVVRVITPGTVIESTMLNESQNNYIAACYLTEETAGISFSDISTGVISATGFSGEGALESIVNELATYMPHEIVLNVPKGAYPYLDDILNVRFQMTINYGEELRFEDAACRLAVLKQFNRIPEELNESNTYITCALGALLSYISETQKTDIRYIRNVNIYQRGSYLEMDINTRRNLELCETMRSKEKKGSLLWVLDRTKTAAGARMLRKWLEMPLIHVKEIVSRQQAITLLVQDFMKRQEIALQLSDVHDLERLMTRVIYGTAGPKELRSIADTLKLIPPIRKQLADCSQGRLKELYESLDELGDMLELIDRAIIESPPFSVREGGFIRKGYSEEVDECRDLMTDSGSMIEAIEQREREEVGIKNLKVRYNKVFGYYLEVPNSFTGTIPPTYQRKQTLVNCERYITDELKDLETRILSAADRDGKLEYELFQHIREKLIDNTKRIQSAARLLAELDAYVSLADVAKRNNYVCPEITYTDVISIKDGRHPVVEKFATDGYFVPNDTNLDTRHNRLMLITGPNMAGKSTYMRQVALITVMAQIGSYVPAKEASIGIVDKVFTRVGASDDLASGQSTFMLEMSEVAYILKNATKKSLILYDEIGRGTSTFDGMSIARAIAEYTVGPKLGAKTLFATHYHELCDLEEEYDGVVNYNIAAKKKQDSITFLRRIVKGATDDSYGIEVAKLAGVPSEVIKRAKTVLSSIESEEKRIHTSENKVQEETNVNVTFEDMVEKNVIETLKKVNIDTLTPIEAMNVLYQAVKQLN